MVVSPEARTSVTICNAVNILMRDGILVNLGFHMCGHCLSTLISFFEVKERQIRIGRMDLSAGDLRSGESTFGRNDLVPP